MIVHLIGYPGTGKYTVACSMAERWPHRLVVMDNHLTANPILHVVGVDGVRRLPPVVWERVGEIRDLVSKAIEDLSPPDWSFVFTNVLDARDERHHATVAWLQRLAEARRQPYVPVLLRCDLDELLRRVVTPERHGRMKWIDADAVRAYATSTRMLVPDGTLTLDITDMTPEEAADTIRQNMSRRGSSV